MEKELLIKECIQGNSKAHGVFYDLHSPFVMGICLRYAKDQDQANDIFQEAFIKIFKHLASLKDLKSLKGWMKQITIRSALDQLQSEKFPADTGLNGFQIQDGNYERLLDEISNETIILLINQLPDGYRTVFNLHVIDGYSHKEIAAVLGITQSTSRSQLTYARKSLQKQLEKLGITKYESII